MPSPLCTLMFYCYQGLLLNEAGCQEYVCVNCLFSSLVSSLAGVPPEDLCEGKSLLLRSVASKGVICMVTACTAGALLGCPCWPASVRSSGCMFHGTPVTDVTAPVAADPQGLFLLPGSRHSHSAKHCSVCRLKWKTNLCYFTSLQYYLAHSLLCGLKTEASRQTGSFL